MRIEVRRDHQRRQNVKACVGDEPEHHSSDDDGKAECDDEKLEVAEKGKETEGDGEDSSSSEEEKVENKKRDLKVEATSLSHLMTHMPRN